MITRYILINEFIWLIDGYFIADGWYGWYKSE